MVKRKAFSEAADEAALLPTLSLLRHRMQASKYDSAEQPTLREELPVPEHLQEQYRDLLGILKQTVASSQNHSVLVVGPRGCGKSCLVNTAIADIARQYKEQISVVRLNGLVHTDDRIAVKAIAQQLCAAQSVPFTASASFFDNLSFLPKVLEDSMRCHRAVLVVMEEFDLFASHAKQTLLYNLLDLLQRGKVQMAVVGVSGRLDNLSLLEKRVRSRFSHRRLLCAPPSPTSAVRILKDILRLPECSPTSSSFRVAFNEAVEKVLSSEDGSSFVKLQASQQSSLRHLSSLAACIVAHFQQLYSKVRGCDRGVATQGRYCPIIRVLEYPAAEVAATRMFKCPHNPDVTALNTTVTVSPRAESPRCHEEDRGKTEREGV
eukprot:scaffold1667_cov411-Prasinococcus_capsulatus_cf.AAC.2